ncbi:MAG TPA: trehalose-phosphatase, partial [Allosphingosinicella sp.]|nr:trehalose-phosphatase [Allosphingosinicella sp.]
ISIGLEDVRAKVEAFAAATPGLLVEEKPAGIALHYRLAPEQGPRADAFIAALARARGFSVQRGAMVVELRPAGATKGDALKAFMTEPDFAGARPWFVGDDLTDEHAFEAAATLGGAGILVGAERASAARHRLASVAEVARWLEAAA